MRWSIPRFSFAVSLLSGITVAGLTTTGCGGHSDYGDIEGVGESSSGGSSGGGSGSGSNSSSGTGSSSGFVSGSSSGFVSGSSSGFVSGSSSGFVSGSSSGFVSGSSSGSWLPCPEDPPTGACTDYGQSCSYDIGCGETCECPIPNIYEPDYGWTCTVYACPPPPPPSCPTFPPTAGTSCDADDFTCSYAINGDCNTEWCTCAGDAWECSYEVNCGVEDAGSDDAAITLPP
jgi:hypothetical protein